MDEYKMDETKLADLFYDKLCDSDENDMFEPYMADNMALVYDNKTDKQKIALTIGDTEYVWTLEKHDKGEFEVFENEPTLKIGE